jgi:hypothetical protein
MRHEREEQGKGDQEFGRRVAILSWVAMESLICKETFA